jgi:hypothetical protein
MNAIIAFCDLPNPRKHPGSGFLGLGDFQDLVNGANFGNDLVWNIL